MWLRFGRPSSASARRVHRPRISRRNLPECRVHPEQVLSDSTERLYEARNKLSHHGIKIEGITVDLATMLDRKDKVVKQLTGGVGFLFKKNKIDSFIATGRIVSQETVEVKSSQGTQLLKTKNILIATGSGRCSCRGLRLMGVCHRLNQAPLCSPRSPRSCWSSEADTSAWKNGLSLEPPRL